MSARWCSWVASAILVAALYLEAAPPLVAAGGTVTPERKPNHPTGRTRLEPNGETKRRPKQQPQQGGVRQVREEEHILRTTEERVLPQPELPQKPGRERPEPSPAPGGLKPFGWDLFAADTEMFLPTPGTAVPANYTLGPGDELEVGYWSDFLPQQTADLVVDPQGQLALPEGGTVSVRGLTLLQTRQLIRDHLLRLYKQVKVHVALSKLRTIRVWVIGEVKKPGSRLVSPLSTAFNALCLAGGPNERGSMRRIRLMRGHREVALIDLYKYLLTGDSTDDIPLRSGDRLFVPVVGPTVTVHGEVRRPAIFELTGGERLQDVLDWAGGLKPTGYAPRIQIVRVAPDGHRTIRDVNLSPATQLGPETTNPPVRAGDVIRVLRLSGGMTDAVRVEGEISRPTSYQWTPGLTVRDVLLKAKTEGVLGERPLSRGQITRFDPAGGTRLIAFAVDRALAGDNENNVKLQPRDRVTLYLPAAEGLPLNVHISGPVVRPGRYRYVSGMTVKDLLNWAGGITDQAEVVHCTLERVFAPSEAVQEETSPRMRESTLRTSTVRTRRRHADQWVFVDGRVAHPSQIEFEKGKPVGYYLEKAGGLLPDADRESIRIYRVNSDVLKVAQVTALEPGDRLFVPPTEHAKAETVVNAKYVLDHVPPGQRTISVVIDLDKVEAGDPKWNVELQPGDEVILYTPEALRWHGGYVIAQGQVVRPGAYECAEGMTVADLLVKAGGLLPDASTRRALVERTLTDGQKQVFVVDLDKARAGDADNNLPLHERDKLVVFRYTQVNVDRREVRIDGAVQNPGDYPRTKGMKLTDLILAAGGLLPEAHNVAEIVRLAPDGRRHRLTADLTRLLQQGDESQNVVLQDYDSVSIPSVSRPRRLAQSVTVLGEVQNPGVYFLEDPQTTLAAVLRRAGGLTGEAFLPGATIRRRADKVMTEYQRLAMQSMLAESRRVEAKEYLATAAARATTALPANPRYEVGTRPGDITALGEESGGAQGVSVPGREPVFTYVTADFAAALAEPGSDADVQLQDGDVITVPRRPVAVLVVGAVVRESAILYTAGRGLTYYLDQAGGLSPDARRDQIEIIRANGSTLPAGRVSALAPGDIVFVPSRAILFRRKKSWLETLQSFSPLLSLAILARR